MKKAVLILSTAICAVMISARAADRTISSNYTLTASDRVVMKFRFADNDKIHQFLFCTRFGGSKQSFTMMRSNSTTTNVRIDHGGNQKSANLSLTSGKDYLIVMNGDTPYWETIDAVREMGGRMYQIRAGGNIGVEEEKGAEYRDI